MSATNSSDVDYAFAYILEILSKVKLVPPPQAFLKPLAAKVHFKIPHIGPGNSLPDHCCLAALLGNTYCGDWGCTGHAGTSAAQELSWRVGSQLLLWEQAEAVGGQALIGTDSVPPLSWVHEMMCSFLFSQ